MQNQILAFLGDIQPFLEECQWSPPSCSRLLDILLDRQANHSSELLKMELAVTVDTGKIFVQKTYQLEGDGVLSPDAHTHLQEVVTAAADAYYPNVASAKAI